MKCPFCGFEFDEPDKSTCSGCGKLHSCNMQKCPNCKYEIPKETKLEKLLRGVFK
jgi:predicted amidophosphoribosyltransferase